MSDQLRTVVDLVHKECRRAFASHSPFASAHEGYSVILEELDELWEEVKKRRNVRSNSKMLTEAIQVSAMCVRFIHDLKLLEKSQSELVDFPG